MELPIRTLQRWLNKGIAEGDRRLTAKRPVPANKLSDDDVARILEICNREEYASLPPSQIVPRLADDNVYLASESTFYRVLKAHNQLHHRGRSQTPRKVKAPTSYTAEKPNQVWSWDITYCVPGVQGEHGCSN
ncbi:transposase [Photobacterium proteolyticum]|uniref:Transposase n=1 Tax=Photobacterium proteolyticum TaxID=1903952 RepID=A0A1Q9GM82_9GAMM|nr:transposase [Photobacterium proteolyticum]